MSITRGIIEAAAALRDAAGTLKFSPPVTHIYNPLDYAWAAHEQYLRRCATSRKKVVFLGMNPGPFGMAQTGIPFGEVGAVRDWLGINAPISRPDSEHPKRPIQGLAYTRSEVSGRRLWGLFAAKFGSSSVFFQEHFVVNYCPLAFLEESGRNRTPDKLPANEAAPLIAVCDRHLRRIVEILQPEWLVGVGAFAEKQARAALDSQCTRFGRILHPSPASPAANSDWPGQAIRQMETMGIW